MLRPLTHPIRISQEILRVTTHSDPNAVNGQDQCVVLPLGTSYTVCNPHKYRLSKWLVAITPSLLDELDTLQPLVDVTLHPLLTTRDILWSGSVDSNLY
jgi:hypothetical protein